MPKFYRTTPSDMPPPSPGGRRVEFSTARLPDARPQVLVAELASVTKRTVEGVLDDLAALKIGTFMDWTGHRPAVLLTGAQRYAASLAAGTLDAEVKAVREKAQRKAKDAAAWAEHEAACEEWTQRRTEVVHDAADEAERKLARAGYPTRERPALGEPAGTPPTHTEACNEARKAAAIAAGAEYERRHPVPMLNGSSLVAQRYLPAAEGDAYAAALGRLSPARRWALELADAAAGR
jgi:hypothetical protein